MRTCHLPKTRLQTAHLLPVPPSLKGFYRWNLNAPHTPANVAWVFRLYTLLYKVSSAWTLVWQDNERRGCLRLKRFCSATQRCQGCTQQALIGKAQIVKLPATWYCDQYWYECSCSAHAFSCDNCAIRSAESYATFIRFAQLLQQCWVDALPSVNDFQTNAKETMALSYAIGLLETSVVEAELKTHMSKRPLTTISSSSTGGA